MQTKMIKQRTEFDRLGQICAWMPWGPIICSKSD